MFFPGLTVTVTKYQMSLSILGPNCVTLPLYVKLKKLVLVFNTIDSPLPFPKNCNLGTRSGGDTGDEPVGKPRTLYSKPVYFNQQVILVPSFI